MTHSWQIALLFLASYLVGGIPVGLIVSRMKGVDIRQHGSGNYGATNVGRVLGRKWGVLVLLLDALKGASTSVGAFPFLASLGVIVGGMSRDWIWLGTGLSCVIGNTAPIYLRFKGGKGVATSLGVIVGIYPYLTLPAAAALIVWLLSVFATRYVSLGSILAAITVPVSFVALSWPMEWTLAEHLPLLGLGIAAASVVVFRHRSNIGRLLSGTEPKIGSGIKSSPQG